MSRLRDLPYNFLPLKIEFRLQSPLALAHPWLHLEGIVAHLWHRMNNPHYRALPSKRVEKVQGRLTLPLKRYYCCHQFIYHASVGLIDAETPEEAWKALDRLQLTKIYKRFYERGLDYNRVRVKKISRGSGYFKDFAMSLPYIPAKRVVFYANGDPDILEVLFEALPGLGKKTAIGYGFIRDFKIKELSENRSIVMDGYAMRPIPYFMLKHHEELVMLAYKAPFWAKESVALCAPPFTKVELKEGAVDERGVERIIPAVV